MAQDIQKRFGFRVQRLRKAKGLSQEKLAHKVGVHRTYMGFVERGERNPTLTKIERMAKALGVSISDLFS
jgi:transcriptional regulator with XRE-family HTH domain